ncbi:hypothetical protein DOTSEDRAFT_44468 [Dothistroma septosporum NZE10]|uniref:Uncharacterized protein n=1 Tax=Dothistroma septosporum (strain NZE10 / CBS 128990) TaxID=675120 RepID=N1PLI7_DOTSN|nr:hypothetical protein DOTSEDRAFT_44468 [Dothistroma septosporum NZE10]
MQSPRRAPSNENSDSYNSRPHAPSDGYNFVNQHAAEDFQAQSRFVAEAPNDREIALADSIPLYKRT